MRRFGRGAARAAVLIGIAVSTALAQQRAALSQEEEDKLREAQDPGQRIEVYLELEQSRIDQFVQARQRPADPQYDTGAYLNQLLGQYIALNDEMKDWIDYQYQRLGDMRKGLRALLDRGPRQLAELRQIQQNPDAYAADYRDTLNDAVADLSDALDGATKALAEQEKKFGELKREEKIQAQQAKQDIKEEKKREKQEKKLRKKEVKHGGVPEDPDQR